MDNEPIVTTQNPNKSIIVTLNLVALTYFKFQFLPANRQGHTITLRTRHNLNQIPQQNFKMADLKLTLNNLHIIVRLFLQNISISQH